MSRTFGTRFLGIIFLGVLVTGDPCSDIGPLPDSGNYGLCLQESLCPTEPLGGAELCPSFPADHICCDHPIWPGRQHRGAWIATVSNIDWPISPSSDVDTQQAELRHLLDKIAEAGLNAVYFQVRPAGDALYQSSIEPWSTYLTGTQGEAPNPLWDPLQFVIDYCKDLNMEVHAWINPYRANLSPTTTGLAPNHMAIMFPEYAYTYSSYVWMDPGAQQVQDRTFEVALDLVTRYDIDGLHMDDYFYPYPAEGWTFPDSAVYQEYLNSGGTLDLEDWRRDNVNKLVERLNTGLHEAKPWIKFSVSPFGIYRPGHEEGMPSPPIFGFDQYSEIYCDPKLWMIEGWVDILQPQLYWQIAPPEQSYPTLLDWWVAESQNPRLRHVYAGNYLSRVDIDDWHIDEIRQQIDISKSNENRLRGSYGNVMFSSKMFRDDIKGTVGFFKTFVYPTPALQPLLPWLNGTYTQHFASSIQNIEIVNSSLNNSGTSKIATVFLTETFNGKISLYYKNELENRWKLVTTKWVNGNQVELNLNVSGNYATALVNRFNAETSKVLFTA